MTTTLRIIQKSLEQNNSNYYDNNINVLESNKKHARRRRRRRRKRSLILSQEAALKRSHHEVQVCISKTIALILLLTGHICYQQADCSPSSLSSSTSPLSLQNRWWAANKSSEPMAQEVANTSFEYSNSKNGTGLLLGIGSCASGSSDTTPNKLDNNVACNSDKDNQDQDDDDFTTLIVADARKAPLNERSLLERLVREHPSERNLALLKFVVSSSSPTHTVDFQVFRPSLVYNNHHNIERRRQRRAPPTLSRPNLLAAHQSTAGAPSNQKSRRTNRTSVIIKAFNYKLRLELELNDVLFGPNLVQKHFIPKGTHISAHQLDNCYYHARSIQNKYTTQQQQQQQPVAIGAFRTCNGLSGIIHVNNESLVIHPFYNNDLTKKQPHIIYRYQQQQQQRQTTGGFGASDSSQHQPGATFGECGNSRAPNEWTLRQFNKPPLLQDKQAPVVVDVDHHDELLDKSVLLQSTPINNNNNNNNGQREKRDVALVEKYIELALVLSKDMFSKRNTSSRLEVLHDTIQVINCLDLYFRRSINTRVGLVYIETWAHGDQIELSTDVKQTLYSFLDYTQRNLYGTSMDAAHLITGGHAQQFDGAAFGMSIPDSVCTSKAVSVSQDASVLEPFVSAATIAHLLGHILGMEHDNQRRSQSKATTTTAAALVGQQQQQAAAPLVRARVHKQQQQQVRTRQQEVVVKTSTSSSSSTAAAANADTLLEDHDDELKSRSLTVAELRQAAADEQQDGGAVSLVDNQLDWDESGALLDDCQLSNCIMNEKFVYMQPPVALGNMIQQQVHVNNNNGPPIMTGNKTTTTSEPQQHVNMFSIQETAPTYSSGDDDENSLESLINLQQSTIGDNTLNGQRQNNNNNNNSILDLGQSNTQLVGLAFKFSRQSADTYNALLREGRAFCLWNKPNKLETSILSTCGNGIVERDEDCDCGARADCWSDTCCERLTCKFRKGVECISGACCDRCKFRSRGFVCRRARGECDLAELCDGKSAECGADVHKHNGWPCNAHSGYCFMGQCPEHDTQCTDLWGSSARSSDALCYTNLNTNGTIFGNCGTRPQHVGTAPAATSAFLRTSTATASQVAANSNKYKRCEPDNALCGTLQCQSGDMKPVTAAAQQDGSSNSSSSGGNYEFSRKILRHNGRDHECKVITRPATGATGSSQQHSTRLSSIVYVRDGTKCGERRVCLEQVCQALERAFPDPFELCPRDERGQLCSGHGVCSTANRCHCDDTWTGHDCSQAAPLVETQISIEAPASNTLGRRLNQALVDNSTLQQLVLDATTTTTPTVTQQTSDHQQAATTTIVPSSTTIATVAPPSPPPPVPMTSGTTTTSVQDKKKHDALSANTLVFILVSIVAAVYVGFALMANCYRRKGFIKPDKVLRHHQMNCKLDALRSSFIAKRLADAEATFECPTTTTTATTTTASTNHSNNNNMASGPTDSLLFGPGAPIAPVQQLVTTSTNATIDLMSPFVSPQVDQAANAYQQYLAAANHRAAAAAQMSADFMRAPAPVSSVGDLVGASSSNRRQQQQQQQQIQATVHYVDRNTHTNFVPAHDIPLLPPPPPRPGADDRRSSRARPFGVHASGQAIPFNVNEQQQQQVGGAWTTMRANLRNPDQRSTTRLHSSINRATSLGNVHKNVMSTQMMGSDDEEFECECDDCGEGAACVMHQLPADSLRRRGLVHGGLVTPSRVRRHHAHPPPSHGSSGHLATHTNSSRHQWSQARMSSFGRHFAHDHNQVDSCSAPSSPEHRPAELYWARGGAAQNYYQVDDQFNGDDDATLRSTSSRFRSRQSLKKQRSIEQQAHLMSPLSSANSPPPPPPPLAAMHEPLDGAHTDDELVDSSGGGAGGGEDGDDDSSSRPHARRKRTSTRNTVVDLHHHKQPKVHQTTNSIQEHHLSLIAQLQQLEQVQSLHQKQTTNSGGTTLHEFFSLPLSVQLSALLARSLAEPLNLSTTLTQQQQQQQACPDASSLFNQQNIDEYLNLLNNSNVATSSRRSFSNFQQQQQQVVAPGTSKQAPPTNSRSNTMQRKQQLKLHNLQSLIGRLQKLHNQTVAQQHYKRTSEFEPISHQLTSTDNHDLHMARQQAVAVQRLTSMARQQQQQVARCDDIEDSGRHAHPSRSSSRNHSLGAGDGSSLRRVDHTQQYQQIRRSDSQRSRDRNLSANDAKGELVYSMSDSEDGTYVTHMLNKTTKYLRNQQLVNEPGDEERSTNQHNIELNQSPGSTVSSSSVVVANNNQDDVEHRSRQQDNNELVSQSGSIDVQATNDDVGCQPNEAATQK